MEDRYGRKIDYLRISVTDRCNLSCCYCKPEISTKLRHNDILTYEEILEFCWLAVSLGISKFKITGGEPLLRRGCIDFLSRLKAVPGVQQVTLTTNGIYLAQYLTALRQIGLDGINISLDTVDAAAYKSITGSNASAVVMQAIQQAAEQGFKVKINCVPLAQMSVQELMQLLRFAESAGVPLRFIELMPLSCNQQLRGLTGEEIRDILGRYGIMLQAEAGQYGNGPAVYYRADNLKIPVGFIQPIHDKFCSSCNRVRLTSDGFLKTCLYSDAGIDIKKMLRGGCSSEQIRQAVSEAVFAKPAGHQFADKPGMFRMNEIGG